MKMFRITGEMGSIEFFLTSQQERWYAECADDLGREEFITHEAWRRLWDSDASKMLKNLCDNLGVDKVKTQFSRQIHIEEVKS
jgi:hypothetical protein